jgi:acyl-CoA dehydrogenase
VAEGSKFYIGNANAASIISILAKHQDSNGRNQSKRTPFAFVALRAAESSGFRNLRKIRTLGVRTAFVGEFDVIGHELPDADVICQGRQAWDAVFGTVTLGKFLLGFGSVGICEHALQEAIAHLSTRVLFNRPVVEMPHLQQATAHAYARLTAMKLYAYRALDYLHAAREEDRRYLLFNAVQKAKVSTEGVKVVTQLSECIGAKGFEADTYFEGALRDIQLIPSLEGSTHVNYTTTAQFLSAYLFNADATLAFPGSLTTGQVESQENEYLMRARTGGTRAISFDYFLRAYRSFLSIPNVRLFVKQAKAFRLFVLATEARKRDKSRVDWTIALGRCLSTLAYAQLIAENAVLAQIPNAMVSVIFAQLVESLSNEAIQLAALAPSSSLAKLLIERMDVRPQRQASDLLAVAELIPRVANVAV